MPLAVLIVINGLSALAMFVLGSLYGKSRCSGKKRDKPVAVRDAKSFRGAYYLDAVYDKFIDYLSVKKAFLRPDLSLEDVSRALFTNRLYISESVKKHGGRNFKCVLNKFRVEHAMALFENDPSLRVNELAYRSGFNSATSFNIAFKVMMNMPPGEWCRRYRIARGMDFKGDTEEELTMPS